MADKNNTKKKNQRKEKKPEKARAAEIWKHLLYNHMTEKSIGLIEKENKLVFIVNRKSKKSDIKKAVESALDVKVSNVKTVIDQRGRKKAFVRLDKSSLAGEVATRLGMI